MPTCQLHIVYKPPCLCHMQISSLKWKNNATHCNIYFFTNVHQIIAFKGLWIQNMVRAVSLASWFCLQNVSISFFLKRTDDSVFWRREPQANSQLTPSAVTSIVLLAVASITKGNCYIHGKRKKVQECQDKWDNLILELL